MSAALASLVALLLAAIPRVLWAIAAKLFTDSFLNAVLTKLLIFGLKEAVKLTSNTVDDEIVLDIERRMKNDGI